MGTGASTHVQQLSKHSCPATEQGREGQRKSICRRSPAEIKSVLLCAYENGNKRCPPPPPLWKGSLAFLSCRQEKPTGVRGEIGQGPRKLWSSHWPCGQGVGWGAWKGRAHHLWVLLNKHSQSGLPAPETEKAVEPRVANTVLSALEASPGENFF